MIAWKAYYPHGDYDCVHHLWPLLPEYGIQALKIWTHRKGRKFYSVVICGIADDPSIYRLPGEDAVKIGTMLPDDEYERIRTLAMMDEPPWLQNIS